MRLRSAATRVFSIALMSSALWDDTLRAETAPLESVRTRLAAGDGPVKIVCFGDSVTGIYYHTGGVRAYPELLEESLRHAHPGSELSVVNAGRSGHTTADALGRLARDVLSHRPDLVTVMFGLNDVAKLPIESYRKNLIDIVSKCRSHGAEVILCTSNAVTTTENRPADRVFAYSEVVRSVSLQFGVPLCDSFAELESLRSNDPTGWRLAMSDEFHPNLDGHRLIAGFLASAITGQETSVPESGPPPLDRALSRLAGGEPVRVLAMPPFDDLVGEALAKLVPAAKVSVTPWPTEGLTRYELMKDAAHRVRAMAPDLVLVAVPEDAAAEDREQFIRTQMWITSNSLSRGEREWDVVVVHPRVVEADSDGSKSEEDEIIRIATAAQDVAVIDRSPGDLREAAEILADWIEEAWNAKKFP